MKKKRNGFNLTQSFVAVLWLLANAFPAYAEFKAETVFPAAGIMGQDLNVTLKGSGFDETVRVIMYPDAENIGAVAEIADTPGRAHGVTVKDGIAYIADGRSGLQIIDIAGSEVIGFVNTPGEARDVAVSGETAYIADGSEGLQIFDISNPSAPRHTGNLDTPGYAAGIAVSERIVCVADRESGLQVIDVSDPENPFLIGYTDTAGQAYDVAIKDGKAYIADGTGGIRVADISVPAVIGYADTPGTAYGITITGGFAYIADGTKGLQIINIAEPAAPKLIGTEDTPGIAYGVAISDSTAYIADGHAGIQMIDISDLYNPLQKAAIYTRDIAYGVAADGDMLCVADGESGLQGIDVSNISDGSLMGMADTPGFAYNVTLSGNTAYVADGTGGLQIVSVANLSSPRIAGTVKIPDKAYGAAIVGNTAYIAAGSSGLQIADVRTPSAAALIGSEDTPSFAQGLAVKDGIAYVADWNKSLHLINVSTPSEPVLIKSVGMPGAAMGIVLSGNFAFVADGNSGLQILDIATPSKARITGSLDTPGMAFGVAVAGDIAYVADGSSGLQVIDVSEPSAPAKLSSLAIPGGCSANSIAVVGDIAYIADGEKGLRLIDVSNPFAPKMIGSADTPGSPQGLAVSGDTAYLAVGTSGLTIVPIPVEISPLTLSGETGISLTLPAPRQAGHYTLRLFNSSESYEIPGAVSFVSSAQSAISESKAILVAGSGEAAGRCSSQAYAAILRQGYDKANIYYLSPDITIDADRDGESDVNEHPTYESLSYAVNTWAKSSASDLLVYMTGQSNNNAFILEGSGDSADELKPEALDSWLDNLQKSLTGSLIFIYDGSRAGFSESMMPPSGKKRIVITSASAEENAYFYDSGRFSFSYQFWSAIYSGFGLYDAFISGRNIMECCQTALLDADGDGKANEKQDRSLAQDIVIGRGYRTALNAPKIQTVSEDFLLQGENAARLRAEGINSPNGLKDVFTVIVPPTKIPDPPDPMELSEENYETYYGDFTQTGAYKIYYYASDNQGLYSLPKQTRVIQTNGNPAPAGDLTGDWTADLADLIIALRSLTGADVSASVWWNYSILNGDVNGDAKIGWEEVFYIFRTIVMRDA
jgi:hypothetical protein